MPRLMLILLICISAVAIGLLVTLGATAPRHAAISSRPVMFDASRALAQTGVLAQRYPDRVVGSEASHRAADYLQEQYQMLGYQTSMQGFSMWRRGQLVRGHDIVAYLPGSSRDALAILAHYDEPTTAHEAAEDDASGVGVALELARVLRSRPLRHGLVIVATDAEEWGMIGARRLVPVLRQRHTQAAIVIDYVNAGGTTGLRFDCTGQFSGFSPMWLRALARDAALTRDVGEVEQPSGISEWMYRSVELSLEDQGPLLDAGIPAINIETIPADAAGARQRYHTPGDAFRNFDSDPSAFEKIGSTAERLLYSFDASPLPIGDGDGDFLLGDERVIRAPLMLVVQLCVLAPFLFLLIASARAGDAVSGMRSWFVPALWGLPILAAAFTLQVLAAANILPRYELYPATTKDPFLYVLPPQAAIPTLGVLVVGIVVLALVNRPYARSLQFAAAKRALVAWLCGVLLIAFFINRYGALALLGPVAASAALTLAPIDPARRTVNAIVLLAGASPFAALLFFFSGELYLGWHIIWYVALQAAYGVWSLPVILLFSLASALWVQLVWLCIVSPPTGASHPRFLRSSAEVAVRLSG